MNDRRVTNLAGLVRLLILPLLLLFVAGGSAAQPGLSRGPVLTCTSVEPDAHCRPIDLNGTGAFAQDAILARDIRVAPGQTQSSRPLMVWLVAMASSEVRWNGVVIGRNGVPGPDAASERPGRFIAAVAVPPRLVRPGINRVTVTMSSHHLPLPVRRTVHVIDVLPYQPVVLPGLSHYLPALLMLGGLGATGLFFAVARLLDPGDRAALLLALIAGAALVQLALETTRSFFLYTYPWHVARVGAVALVASVTAVMIAAYAAHRFAPDRLRLASGATAAGAVAAMLLIPWYDIKALAALMLGFVALLACTLTGWRRGVRGSAAGFGVALLFFLLLGWQRTEMLDRFYYILITAILVGLAAENLLMLRDARRGRDSEALRAQALETRLSEQRRTPEMALLKDGSRTHHVAEADIVYARAADDYSEVVLRDGRILLVTMNLARLLEALSGRFVRVHKSYAVNVRAVEAVGPRPGGGKQLLLVGGRSIPVGRSYGNALRSMNSPRTVEI